MALLLHLSSSSSSFLTTINKIHLHLHHFTPKSTLLIIRSQDPSSEDTTTTTSTSTSSSTKTPPTKPNSPGLGFGSSNDANPLTTSKKKQKPGKGSVIRRAPVQKPKFGSDKEEVQSKEQGQSESAFLLTWTALGGIILAEGLILAASGFFPEEWDRLFVKYLYPSFTPTVFLFVAGSVAFGVLKYLQNEKFNKEN